MENRYTSLTKKIKNDDGTTSVICAFVGTERCPLHKNNNADGQCVCSLMATLMREQLQVFEEIYLEDDRG